MPGRQISVAAKMAVLAAIEEKKDILLGRFGQGKNDGPAKTEAWQQIRLTAIHVQATTADRDWTFVRDKLWGTWKSKALEKRDKAREVWARGGKPVVMSQVENKILEIVGNESAAIGSNLNVLQTEDKSSDYESLNADNGNETNESEASHHMKTASTQTTMSHLQQKRKLQIQILELQKESLELEVYEKRLRSLVLERQLHVVRSSFTQGLK